MTRFAIILLIAAAEALPAAAQTKNFQYDVPCGKLWPAVTDVIRNSGKYRPLSVDQSGMTAAYKVDDALSPMNDAVALVASGRGCQLQIDAPYHGWLYNDALDMKKRVDKMLAAATSGAAPAASQASAANSGLTASPQPAAAPAAVPTPAPAMAPAPAPVPALVVTSAPVTPAPAVAVTPPVSAPVPTASRIVSGARVTLAVDAHCVKDPDPLGLVSNSNYSPCSQKELNQIRSWIAAALTPQGIQLTDVKAGFDYQFAITLTKDMDKRPSSLIPFGDFANGTVMLEGTYQVLDPAGHVLATGSVAHQGPDKHPADVQKQFAQKIAASLPNAFPGAVPPAAAQ